MARKKAEPKYVCPEKRPRQYAVEIMNLPREERKDAFSQVPEHLRDLVMKHCGTIQMIRKYHRRKG